MPYENGLMNYKLNVLINIAPRPVLQLASETSLLDSSYVAQHFMVMSLNDGKVLMVIM